MESLIFSDYSAITSVFNTIIFTTPPMSILMVLKTTPVFPKTTLNTNPKIISKLHVFVSYMKQSIMKDINKELSISVVGIIRCPAELGAFNMLVTLIVVINYYEAHSLL